MGDRADLAMLIRLTADPGWYDGLPKGTRKRVMRQLLDVLSKPELRPRELVAVAKVLSTLERNDIERCKLLKDLVVEDAPEEGDGEASPPTEVK